MYLRPDEVAKVLESTGFKCDSMTDQAYGYRKGEHYVYVNREARMGRTALVIHPELKERSRYFATPASPIRVSEQYLEFPLDVSGDSPGQRYGIPHGFSSREALSRYLYSMFL
ncbi:DUF2002 family protein [Serratia rhizosphaerae]|uniref:DUF2002 family protein n=1 Tax=unclassified Serratia (in: enterobacteria) TaxID=2647522 RepID=UPI000CF60DE1|nr:MULTISPECIES: DUF2002 family protein [unclassified Serratia (in: enterobacteria)]MBU3891701.1 DUF2002 family protein [Serratia rubidaea]AVJ18922.1 hypothetical protein CLM71_18185 [Serratia sp. MYb239]MCA4825320.1 YgaC family protein [Serratia rubidaea]QNK33572.1 YgaC family protein [Serratia sp. JUb9]QPT12480.1 YgaC family protein [Serratia rubidaea]